MEALQTFLDDAQARHGDHAVQVWAELIPWAARLKPDAAGAEALRLAEHVGLGHCADGPGLRAFVQSLPAELAQADATAVAVQRLRWSLSTLALGGDAVAELPRGQAWRSLQNVVLALARQGRCAAAGVLLAAEEAAALAEGASDGGKAYAATANNVAGHLQADRQDADADASAHSDRDALMLQAAAIARRVWASAGNWMQVERADYRLALCHAVAGDGAGAVHHARLCLAACVAAGEAADAMEHFFAHEALVRAHRARGTDGDAQAAETSRQNMQALLLQIDEADGLRAWCAETMATVSR